MDPPLIGEALPGPAAVEQTSDGVDVLYLATSGVCGRLLPDPQPSPSTASISSISARIASRCS